MSFIKTRKKLVSTAIASSISVIATTAISQDDVTQLPAIEVQANAEKQQSLKVDNSANSKFVAPLLNTPKSVSIISKQLIEDTQVTTLSDALRTVPGITLGAGEGGNPNGDRPFIRGYNSESSMYVDGVRSATSQNREMFAVEQVEVTKGSASAMGGAGTTGGSINMVSKVAKKGDFLEGSVAGGTDAYARVTLDGNKDFGNGIATRVAVMGHMNEKAGQSDGAEYKRAGIAPSITFGLDTPTRATLSYYYLASDDIPDSGIPYNNPFSAPSKATDVDKRLANGNGKPIDVKQGIYYGWKDRDFQKQENQIGTLKLEHDITEDLTLTNIASFSKSKNDYLWSQPDDSKGNFYKLTIDDANKIVTDSSLSGNIWRRVNNRITDTEAFSDQLSLSGKFKTGALEHSFITGAEYTKQDADRTSYLIDGADSTGNAYSSCNTNAINTGNCTPVLNPNPNQQWNGTKTTIGQDLYNTKTDTASIYALDSIKFNSQWILDLGLRWDQFKSDYEMTYGANNADTKPTKDNNQNEIAPKRAVGEKVKYASDSDFFNYQIGLTFKPAENGAIYASYATSANPVGVDAGDGSEGISTPGRNTTNEQAIAINNLKPEEVRTMELGTKWDLFNNKLNLTAAIFRTEKTNTRSTDTDGFTRNIGETRVDGFELGLNGNITDKWAASLGYTYLDSELVDGGFTKVNNIYVPNPNNGNQIENVAKNSATLWTTYAFTPAFTLGAFAMDKVYGNAANTKWVPGYLRYDAMARYNVNKNVDLQLNVNNLSDKRYFSKAYTSHYAAEAEGRSAVLSLNFKY